MSIEVLIHSSLRDNATVGAIVGNRVSPEWRREGTALPAIIYSVDSRDPIRTLGGATGLEQFTVRLECIASNMSGARTLSKAARAVFETNSGFTVGLVEFEAGTLQNEDVERMDDQEGNDDGPRSCVLTFLIWARGG